MRMLVLACFFSAPFFAAAQVDFRKETIYFLLTTRFFDGDTANSRPNEWCSYFPGNPNNPNFSGPEDVTWRGDFKGLIEKLDYIKDMGFTAIWITPIVQNRGPLDYHGYHAWDFTKVDPRLESPGATFKDLVAAVHAKGMKIVLDIVTNHSGRFGIKGMAELKYNTDPTKAWGQKADGSPLPDNPAWEYDGLTKNPDDGKYWSRANLAKMPSPFNQTLSAWNWPSTQSFVTTSDPEWFHHSGNGFAQGWDDTENLYNRALADDCPDLNTSSKKVQDYLFEAYKTFLDAGVDAFRWDTWKHMAREDIWALYDRFKAYKPDLFVFGEVAQKRHELHPVEEINPHWYTWRGAVGSSAPAGVGVIDFYAMSTFHNIFQNGGGLSGVTAAGRYDHLYGDPSLLVTFLDNHDFGPNNDWNQRYGGSPENLAACMNFMFTWRGIPSVYYGTEIQFMKGAYTDLHNASGITKSINETGRAYFGEAMQTAPSHKLYQHIKKLNAIRKAVPALQSGNWNWAGNGPGNGVGYTRQAGNSFVCVGLAKDGNATFQFTGIPNGIYRDAVTGREATVSNGSLSFSVASVSAGIYVKDGPGMIGENGAGYFESCVNGCISPVTMQISPVGSNYNAPVSVTMSASGGSGINNIYYTTDGSTPDINATKYTGAFIVSVNTTIRAVAIDEAGGLGELQAQRYTFEKAPPVLTVLPASGNYFDPVQVTVSASAGTAPYTIRYTLDGTEPSDVSPLYQQPVPIQSDKTFRATVTDAMQKKFSVIRQYTFQIPNPVVLATPASGNFSGGNVSVSLSANSPRPPVVIRYTMDGTDPDAGSEVYSIPLSLSGGEPVVLKFLGEDAEGRKSAIQSATYTFYPIPDIMVYFKRPANWSTNVRIHYFDAQPASALPNSTWPGVPMERVCGDWYRFRFSGVTRTGIVFNDGAGRQTPDLSVTQSNWYNNGWLGTDPGVTKPEADFSSDPGLTGTAPFSVTFNGSLSTACNGIQSYEWDFGNGQTGSGAQPATVFTQPGNFKVKLTVTDMEGQKSVREKTVLISSATEGFWVYFKKPDNWTIPVKVQFSNRMPGNTSIAFPGDDMMLHCGSWYKYHFTNTTAVNLIFRDASGNQFTGLHANQPTSFIDNRKVLGAPANEEMLFANFEITPVTGREPLQVTLNPQAAMVCGSIQSYFWDFGNGSSSTLANPSVTYNQAGVYPVNLRITDNTGNSHQLTKKLVVGTAGGEVILHLRRPPGWNNVPNTYYWQPTPNVAAVAWPGVPMTDEGNGWYTHTISGANCANIIFNNNTNPQSADLLNICGEQWFDNGWLSPVIADASLPVRLVSFHGEMRQQKVWLQWLVNGEDRLSHYELERSTDGVNFTFLHKEPALNNPGEHRYTFQDVKFPDDKTLYYRLQAVDRDGTRKISPVVRIETAAQTLKVLVSPNPVKNEIRITASNTEVSIVRIVSSTGVVLTQQKIPAGQTSILIARKPQWSAGFYYAEWFNKAGQVSGRTKLIFE